MSYRNWRLQGWKEVIVFLLGVACSLALAHGISVWASVEGGKVRCEARASSGKPLKRAQITAKAADGNIVASGVTDLNGIYTFSPRRKEKLEITLFLDAQHTSKFVLEPEDFEEDVAEPTATPSSSEE